MLGQLHDLLHLFDREGVFLPGDLEAHQLVLIDGASVRLGCRGFFRVLTVQCRAMAAVGSAAEVVELPLDGVDRVEDHHHRRSVAALDHAGEQLGIDGGLDGVGAFDVIGLDGHHIGHAIDHQPDRTSLIEHHHARGVVVAHLIEVEHAAQTDHRQHRPAQVGQTLQRRGAQRHPHHVGHADDFLHLGKRHREHLVLHMEDDELPGVARRFAA